jgi:two-component system LytT family sensor kinase
LLLLAAALFTVHWIIKAGIYKNSLPFSAYFFKNAHLFFSTSLFGVIYFFIRYTQYQALHEKELESKANDAELSFLLSQFNPHFLINCLNNIYALVYTRSPKALSSSRSLSEILSFVYAEKSKTIPIATELKYIEEYINLQRLRYVDPIRVVFTMNDNNAQIAPLLLIPFVENAFKHGDVVGETLELHATGNEKRVTFYCRNAIRKKIRQPLSGIGLQNVKRRLELIYPKEHLLEIEDTERFFTVKLTIRHA